jgi:hypothetical protein
MSFEVWQHRNSVLHHPLHPWKQKAIRDRERRIQDEFRGYDSAQYLPSDRRLFLSTADHMLEHHSVAQQEQWLESIDMARMRRVQTRITALTSSRLLMRNWLIQVPAEPTAADTIQTDNIDN